MAGGLMIKDGFRLAQNFSIGFKSGEYSGKDKSSQPGFSIND